MSELVPLPDFGMSAHDLPDGAILKWDPVTGIRVRKVNVDENSYMLVTEQHYTKALLDANAEDRANSFNTGWGDGRIVGRIPLNILTDENIGLMDAIKNYDDNFISKFLESNPALKTRDRI
jgi:hypothetical protein